MSADDLPAWMERTAPPALSAEDAAALMRLRAHLDALLPGGAVSVAVRPDGPRWTASVYAEGDHGCVDAWATRSTPGAALCEVARQIGVAL